MKINILFVNCFFQVHDDYKLFSFAIISFFCTIYWIFLKKVRYCDKYWRDDLLWKYVDNVLCILSRCEMWFEKCDSNFLVQNFFVTIRSRSCEMWFKKYDTNFSYAKIVCDDSFSKFCLISSSMFWLSSLNSTNDVYSFSTYQMTYVCSWIVERRICLFESDSKTNQTISFHQIASDSSNSTRATYQTW
jgi:hypothetical protein